MALTAALFTLSATTSENFDSCSTSVSSHCMTATWSSFTFLVRFGDMNFAVDAICSTTDLGLNHCLIACQAYSPSPRLTLRILLTNVATSPRVHVIRAAAITVLNCWTSQKLLAKIATVLSSNLSSLATSLNSAPPCPSRDKTAAYPPSKTQSHRSRAGFHRTAAASVSQPLCGSVSDRAVGSNLTLT